jgi:hypothetical protein
MDRPSSTAFSIVAKLSLQGKQERRDQQGNVGTSLAGKRDELGENHVGGKLSDVGSGSHSDTDAMYPIWEEVQSVE